MRCAKLSLVALVGVALTPTVAAQAQFYAVTDLGTLGGTVSSADAMNNLGDVVGRSTTASGQSSAFLWHNGVMTNLGILPGFTASIALDINDAGQVVGENVNTNTSAFHGFYYSSGVMQDLVGLGNRSGSPAQSIAHGINNTGLVVAESTSPADAETHAVTWDPVHGYTNLSPNQRYEANAYSINAAGVIAGSYDFQPALFSGGTEQTLPVASGNARAINNANQVVGSTSNGIFGTQISYGHAFAWQNGVVTNYGTLPGFGGSAFVGLNDAGQTVGSVFNLDTSANYTAQHAVMASGASLIDLNSLLVPNSGWTLSSASDINNRGQIVGEGIINGQTHAFLLTPTAVPEPGSMALLLGLTAIGAGFLSRRRRTHRVA